MDTWKEFDQNEITHSAAHHLMAIDDLVQRLGYARVSDIARALNITRGSVSISLAPQIRSGLIIQDENKHLRLSERGQALVDGIKAKRVLMQRLLADVLGVDATQAEIDACKVEHLVSDAAAERLIAFLNFVGGDAACVREFLQAWRRDPVGDSSRLPRSGRDAGAAAGASGPAPGGASGGGGRREAGKDIQRSRT